ncbi:MAG: TIGR01459 family HAD-type hydrolase [Hyphomicrobium sp.]
MPVSPSRQILAPIPILESIAPLAGKTSGWFLDIWGVMHNGVSPFLDACAACERFRQEGGLVVLVSNSPRPRDGVAAQLDRIGVPRKSWDGIVSSGDVARAMIRDYEGCSVVHVGPERDLGIFSEIDVRRSDADEAEAVVCTGLFDDERETSDDYAERLADFAARKLPMICANPDVRVERAGRLVYCAGALAQHYERLGGKVAYAGKPYLPIYEKALETLEDLAPGSSERSRLLAIGDGIHTDIAGAAGAGVRSVFIASGVHVASDLDAAALDKLFPPGGARPIAAMTRLTW